MAAFYRLTNPDAGRSSPYGYLFRNKARCEQHVRWANAPTKTIRGRLDRNDWFMREEQWDRPDDADLYDDDERHGIVRAVAS